MKIVTPNQMNRIDRLAIQEVGIPGVVLMENAALKVVDEIVKTLGNIKDKHIVILAGKGNNGGDAFAAARHLINKGALLDIFVTSERNKITGDAGVNLDILEKIGVVPVELFEAYQLEKLKHILGTADLVVDGIFGTGLKGHIKGLVHDIIEIVNQSSKRVLSIDIPSGVSGETGEVLGTCIKAAKTVTFALPKVGLVVHPGCEAAGELIIADIGIPSLVVDSLDITTHLIEKDYVSNLLPARYNNSNKGNYGKVFIISGSTGMTGAGCLAAGAALRSGSGLVYLGVPASLCSIYDSLLVESVTIPLEDSGTGHLSKACTGKILNQLQGMSAAAVGPGLGVNDDTVEIVACILSNAEIPLVLDADALNIVAKDLSVLKKLKVPAVITPHPGEMSRLMGITVQEVQNNRLETAREFASRWNVITVLKGSRTVVAMPDGTTFINPTGNPGMATGGTGDVLAGIITSWVGQGLKPADAAVCGVYLHGYAGDIGAQEKGVHGLIASDLINALPQAIKTIRNAE